MTPQDLSAGMEIWAVEGVAHCILFYLDLSTFDSALHFIQSTPDLRGYLKDSTLWSQLSQMHFGGQRDARLSVEMVPFHGRDWDCTDRQRTCMELQTFLQSVDDRTHFDEVVTIVDGDIQKIDNVNGQPLDGIVFPTNPHLTNHHVGAAAAVFRRAGPGLDAFVRDPSFRGARPVGSAVVSPAFDAGVDKLIHCVGPSVHMAQCYALLAQTYESAMNAVQREDLQCVVMASVSTGALGVPSTEGALVAMRTIQKFLVTNGWRGKVAVVCNEEHVLRAFSAAKGAVMKDFNVIPPLPENPEVSWLH